MNPIFSELHPYPFEKLSNLLKGVKPSADKSFISLAIGEPQHATPKLLTDQILNNLEKYRSYPSTSGLPELRQTIALWLERRFNLGAQSINPDSQVIPVAGTREALFSFARAVIDAGKNPLLLLPNPFYQIYEGAALFAGAEPYFINSRPELDYQIDLKEVPEQTWRRCQLIYICSPANPSGVVMSKAQQIELLNLAEKYDFVVAADECYSEIYREESQAPQGLLQTAWAMGNRDFRRCVVFHSLSKRSNAPGLRSGFVAGDAGILEQYLKYRTYHGATLPIPTQLASIAAWQDEEHVRNNRNAYRLKFEQVEAILKDKLKYFSPTAGFYLWAQTPTDDPQFTKKLYQQQAVGVLPGSYLSREAHGENPGLNHIRIALVAELQDCVEAAQRIAAIL